MHARAVAHGKSILPKKFLSSALDSEVRKFDRCSLLPFLLLPIITLKIKSVIRTSFQVLTWTTPKRATTYILGIVLKSSPAHYSGPLPLPSSPRPLPLPPCCPPPPVIQRRVRYMNKDTKKAEMPQKANCSFLTCLSRTHAHNTHPANTETK